VFTIEQLAALVADMIRMTIWIVAAPIGISYIVRTANKFAVAYIFSKANPADARQQIA
jgi:hypothetical protein